MELMQCFEQGCKNEVEYSCPCTSPETLSCVQHIGEHMKLPNRTHVPNFIFVEPCKGTKEEILKFLTRKKLKNSKLKGKMLASFSKRLLESEDDIEELLKNLDSYSAEISDYLTKISQAQKLSKSEQDPILGLLNLQPDEAIEKLKKIIPTNQEWSKSAKLFCALGEKIEKTIECIIEDKFEAYLDKRLSNVENTLQEHSKIIKSVNEEHKKSIDSTNDQIANIKESISKLINENEKSKRDLKDWKEEIMLNTKNEIDLSNSQIIKINQDNEKSKRDLKDWKEEIMLNTKNEIDLSNSQIIKINQDNEKSKRDLKDWKEEIMLNTKNEIDLFNSQIIKINQDNEKSKKDLKDWKEEIILNTKNETDLLNSQIIKINQDLSKS
ncbi:unnamed protein product [Blepharisma stoltei]|uniref:Uncharacterized protein n=1 Tax=Blepharisma stoltei TaxID=1481888 RepID=A0AAU9JDA0_9CILI|nr:unnamed protein product [Blepharisma stoltei]